MVRFNEKIGKYELVVNGKVVAKGSDHYMVKRARELGININTESAIAAKQMPKQEKCEFSVDERFQFIEQFVGMVKRKVMNSMIITGDGGLGKTYTVINTLKKLGLKEDTIGEYSGDFIVIKGYSTAKALYRTLWENNDKIIIFDDCDSIHRDPIGANILKGALDSEEKRIITWGAEFSEREELPNRFEFTGRVIFISNLPLMKFPQALLSRSMKVDLTLTTNEKVDRIAHVFQEVDADAFDKKLALDFVRKNAEKFTDLNVRSALNVLKLAKDIGEGWERIALYTVMA
jgi:hypothetical protein